MPYLPDYSASPTMRTTSPVRIRSNSPRHRTLLSEMGQASIWERTPDSFLRHLQQHRDQLNGIRPHSRLARQASPPGEPPQPPRTISPIRIRELHASLPTGPPPGLSDLSPVGADSMRPIRLDNPSAGPTRVTCGICCEIVISPLKLECGHLFCASCLAPACLKAGSPSPPNTASTPPLQCLLCDCKSRAPCGIDPQTSSFLATLPKSPRKLEQSPTAIVQGGAPAAGPAGLPLERIPAYCDWCEKARPEAFCEDCKTALCGACTKAVHSKRGMSMHNIVSVLQCDRSGIGGRGGFAKCPRQGHGRGCMKYFCRECYEPCCSTCVAELHRGHGGIVEISDIVPEVLASVQRQEQTATDVKHSLKEMVSGNQQTRMQFNSTAVGFEHQVKHFFSSLRRELQHQEDALLEAFRHQFKKGRESLLTSTDALFDEMDLANIRIADLERDIRNLGGDGGLPGTIAPTAAVVAHLSANRNSDVKLPSLEGLAVPRGPGFTYSVPPVPQIDAQKLFGLQLRLRDVQDQRRYARLSFTPPPVDSSIVVEDDRQQGETRVSFGQQMDWASLRANDVFPAGGVQKWKVRLTTFDVMVGVVAADEKERPDLHQGNGFFWYVDVSGPAYGSLGTATPAFEALPPLHTCDKGEGVDVVLQYDGTAETLSCTVQGVDKGVVARGISPPVQPAFAFVSGDQQLAVLY